MNKKILMGLLINVSRGKTSPEWAFKAILEEFNGEKERGSQKAYQVAQEETLKICLDIIDKKIDYYHATAISGEKTQAFIDIKKELEAISAISSKTNYEPTK